MNDTNLALLSDLIVLAKADHVVTDSEYDLILKLAVAMKITKYEVDALFEHPLPSVVQKTELQRITHFYKLMLLMNVDQEKHENEIEVIRNLSIKMGIRPGVIDQMLVKMDEYEDFIIPSEELIKIFQTYYN